MAFTLALPCSAAFLFHDPNGTALVDLEIDGHPPLVRFRRAAGMLSLAITHRGGSIEALAAFHLVIAGEQGSAKSVLTKILRAPVSLGISHRAETWTCDETLQSDRQMPDLEVPRLASAPTGVRSRPNVHKKIRP